MLIEVQGIINSRVVDINHKDDVFTNPFILYLVLFVFASGGLHGVNVCGYVPRAWCGEAVIREWRQNTRIKQRE